MVTDEVVQAQVSRTLKLSHLLRTHQGRSLNPVELTQEIKRMRLHSGDPSALDAMFEALDYDQAKIEACIARPIVVERQLRAIFDAQKNQRTLSDSVTFTTWLSDRIDSVTEAQVQAEISQLAEEATNAKSHLDVRALTITDKDRSTAPMGFLTGNTPGKRSEAMDVWTGFEWIVFGGLDVSVTPTPVLKTGAKYTPATDAWQVITDAPVDPLRLLSRESAIAIWTGTEVLVWTHLARELTFDAQGRSTFLELRYQPDTDSWTSTEQPLATTNAANFSFDRSNTPHVWTGQELIVWGGIVRRIKSGPDRYRDDGVLYNPTTRQAEMIEPTGLPVYPSKREDFAMVFSDTDELIIWAGWYKPTENIADNVFLDTGFRYSLPQKQWRGMSAVDAPVAQAGPVAVYRTLDSGGFMLTTAGYPGPDDRLGYKEHTVSLYYPATDTWAAEPFSIPDQPYADASNLFFKDYALTGNGDLIMWSGERSAVYGSGFQWSVLPQPPKPVTKRIDAMSTWTGEEFLVWGGRSVPCTSPCGLHDGIRLRQRKDNSFEWVLEDVIFFSRFQ